LGTQKAATIILLSLGLAVIFSLLLPRVSPLALGWPYLFASAAIGIFLLLKPAYLLYQRQDGRVAAELFDKASYYPLAQLVLVTIFVVLQ
jgi:4-hydroxybenzoate polyprenyltransferase